MHMHYEYYMHAYTTYTCMAPALGIRCGERVRTTRSHRRVRVTISDDACYMREPVVVSMQDYEFRYICMDHGVAHDTEIKRIIVRMQGYDRMHRANQQHNDRQRTCKHFRGHRYSLLRLAATSQVDGLGMKITRSRCSGT